MKIRKPLWRKPVLEEMFKTLDTVQHTQINSLNKEANETSIGRTTEKPPTDPLPKMPPNGQ